MVLTPKLELRQGQQLVMTPQLQQAIRLLQLSNLELSLYVETELERNPLLERDETTPEPPEEAPCHDESADEGGEGNWEADESQPTVMSGTTVPDEGNGAELNGQHGDRGPSEDTGWAS